MLLPTVAARHIAINVLGKQLEMQMTSFPVVDYFLPPLFFLSFSLLLSTPLGPGDSDERKPTCRPHLALLRALFG